MLVVRRAAYERAGGHAAIPTTMHDGLKLPRHFRRAGIATDLFDATPLATCRMYAGWRQVWDGFSKNAAEGMATRRALPVWTVLLCGGHVLPFVMLPGLAIFGASHLRLALAASGCAASWLSRLVLANRFGDTFGGIALHPVGVLMMLAIQWKALLSRRKPNNWRGRSYPA